MWENGTIERVFLSMAEYSPVIIPSGFDMFDSVYAIRVFSFSSFYVSESTAANWINPNKEHKHDNVKNRELVPIPSHILKHPGLARITLVAQQVGRIVPMVAIRVLGYRCCHVVIAWSWWLTTTRLHRKFLWLISINLLIWTHPKIRINIEGLLIKKK